jgi:uncharacterized membrane protein YkoI
MSDTHTKRKLSLVFAGVAGLAALGLFSSVTPVGASGDDHDLVRELRQNGDIMSLGQLLQQPALANVRVLEAELERERGRTVYELELLDESGRVYERYFDAVTGQPLN